MSEKKKATLLIDSLYLETDRSSWYWIWRIDTDDFSILGARSYKHRKSAAAAATRVIRKLGLVNLYDFGETWRTRNELLGT